MLANGDGDWSAPTKQLFCSKLQKNDAPTTTRQLLSGKNAAASMKE